MLLFPAKANVGLVFLVSNLPSQKLVIVSFSTLSDLPANRTSLGTGPISGYRTFLAQEPFCTDSLSWVFDRERWFWGLFAVYHRGLCNYQLCELI